MTWPWAALFHETDARADICGRDEGVSVSRRENRRLHNAGTYLSMVAAFVGGIVISDSSAAAKPRPTVHFIYERGASAADCPDQDTVLNAVRARLGYDPFRESADVTIRASVSRQGDELRAAILLSDGGTSEGERVLVSHRADCTELASAMQLAVSLAIDPLSITRESESQSIIVVPIPAAPPAPAVPSPPPAKPAQPKSFQAGLGTLGSLGASVAPSLGFFAEAGLRAPLWSLSLEGRVDLPRSQSTTGGHIDVMTSGGAFVPCFHREPFGACALAAVVALRGSGRDLNEGRQATTTLVELGARIRVDVPKTGLFALRASLDLASPLTRTTLRVGDTVVWTSPPITLALGFGAVARFR